MATGSNWSNLRRVFALHYDLGYRYLDKCGELMLLLQAEHGYIPGDIKPIGAKLEQPDFHISVEIDTAELTIRQEHPTDNGAAILSAAGLLSKLVLSIFEPAVPTFAGFASHSYRSFNNEDQLHRATLACDAEAHFSLAEELSVQPQSQSVTHEFVVGSFELEVALKEVVLNSPQRRIASAGFRSSARQKESAERRNKAISQLPGPFSTLGLLLELDLRERMPVASDFQEQFELLKKYEEKIQKRYSLSS